MRLIIDKGNTRCKWMLWDGKTVKQGAIIVPTGSNKIDEVIDALNQIIDDNNVTESVMGCVGDGGDVIATFLEQKCSRFLSVTGKTQAPIINPYPTLGADRLGAIVGAWNMFAGTNMLIIDAGTCVTYELLLDSGVYKGGNIAPGLPLRALAMNKFTNALPLIEFNQYEPNELINNLTYVGYNLDTAMLAGLVHGFCFEVVGFADKLREQYPDLMVILTGGDSYYMEAAFAKTKHTYQNIPDLVLRGYNDLFEYNIYTNK